MPTVVEDPPVNNKVTIYTDGACSGNPGPGGWGAVLLYNDTSKEICGGERDTTNNRMELMAVISALSCLKRTSDVVVFTDSKYVKDGITIWMHNWLKTNFKNGKIKNQDLWLELLKKTKEHSVQWQWVKGHSGDFYNELADKLARDGISKINNN